MFHKCKKLFSDERGVSVSTELLILGAITAVIATGIIGALKEPFQELDIRAQKSITEVTGSGF